jgi:hypothetical protein
VAVLILVTATGCSQPGQPAATGTCTIDQGGVQGLLRAAGREADVSLVRVEQETCAPDWVFVRATFKHPDGTPTEPTGFLFHHTGGQWQRVYEGTAPLEPGDPLCGQMPAEIRQADATLRDSCP